MAAMPSCAVKEIARAVQMPLEQMLLAATLLSPEATQVVQEFLQERIKDEIDDRSAVKKLVDHVRARDSHGARDYHRRKTWPNLSCASDLGAFPRNSRWHRLLVYG